MSRRASRTAALAAVLALGACGDSAPLAPTMETRVYAVVLADEQALPANRECPTPEPDVVTGTRFLEGDLTLFPEGAFRWRYTIEHYAVSPGHEETRVEPVSVIGSYTVRGDTLALYHRDDAPARIGRIRADGVELTEMIPCPAATPGQAVHRAELYLTAGP